MDKARWIGTAEAAKRLRVSPQRVRVLIATERLPAELIGGNWIIRVSDLKKVKNRRPGRPKKKE